MKNLLIFIFTCILFFSCNKNKQGIYVNIDNIDQVSIVDIFDKIDIIPLETSQESLIKEVTKIMVADNKLYILDYLQSEAFAFDETGKFISKIGQKGLGPNEYLHISDIAINPQDSSIVLLAPINNRLYVYDTNLLFKQEISLPVFPNSAYQFCNFLNNDTLVFWTSDYQNRLRMFSLVTKEIYYEGFPEEDFFYNKFQNMSPIFDNYLAQSSSNYIYKILTDGTVKDGYCWNFGKYNNDKKELQRVIHFDSQKELLEYAKKVYTSEVVNYIFYLHGVNSKYYYTQIYRKNKPINIFYDRTTKETKKFEKTIENMSIHPIYWSEEYLIGLQKEEYSLDDMIANEILDEDNLKIKQNINEFDNPVLFKYYFKK